ncbi:hypothetical protein QBC39DRAFT_396008 [Podospora conica]|nr:hypothetical protein QBC39DRAFT_396008 [Schizothecium conicum]
MPHLRHLVTCVFSFNERVPGRGFYQNIAIATHPTLKMLIVAGCTTYRKPFFNGFEMPKLGGNTEISTLHSTRIDLLTWAPILKELTKLEILHIQYRPKINVCGSNQRSNTRDLSYHHLNWNRFKQPDVLDKILEPLLERLIYLRFDLSYRADYRWGAFKRLKYLGVPARSFLSLGNWEPFSTTSESILPIIPASLLTLEIIDCDPRKRIRVPGGAEVFQYEVPLLHFLEEVGSQSVQESRHSIPLRISAFFQRNRYWAPVRPVVKSAAERSNVILKYELWQERRRWH